MNTQRTINLRQVNCCATCNHSGGWMDNTACTLHRIETRPYWICKNYSENEFMVKINIVKIPKENN